MLFRSDPDEVTYGIPGNDDAIRSVELLTRVVADAVAAGLLDPAAGRGRAGAKEPAGTSEDEPLPEWEAELLSGTSEATETAASEQA